MTPIPPVNPDSRERLMAPYLAALVRALEDAGGDADAVLADTGLTLAELDQTDAELPLTTGVALLQRLHEAGLRPEQAIRAAPELDLRHQGFLGYAVLASSDLGEALQLAMRYLRTRTQLLTLDSFRDGDRGVIRFDEGVPLGALYPLVMDVLIVSLFRVGRQLFGERLPPGIRVRLNYPERPHHAVLREYIERDPEFDCAWCEVTFPAEWLAQPIGSADPNMARLAAEQCERALRDLEESGGLLGRVRQLAVEHLHEPRSIDKVAAALHITPRTLRRRLSEVGTNYQTLVEQLRERRARELLAHSREPVDEIAARLGYGDPSNFGRAFRRWTGLSPTAWRRGRE
mgnify:CR=1 FL=1